MPFGKSNRISIDGTSDAIAAHRPTVRLFNSSSNGATAVTHCRTHFVRCCHIRISHKHSRSNAAVYHQRHYFSVFRGVKVSMPVIHTVLQSVRGWSDPRSLSGPERRLSNIPTIFSSAQVCASIVMILFKFTTTRSMEAGKKHNDELEIVRIKMTRQSFILFSTAIWASAHTHTSDAHIQLSFNIHARTSDAMQCARFDAKRWSFSHFMHICMYLFSIEIFHFKRIPCVCMQSPSFVLYIYKKKKKTSLLQRQRRWRW